jgi:hypothetical protein
MWTSHRLALQFPADSATVFGIFYWAIVLCVFGMLVNSDVRTADIGCDEW